MPGALVSYNHDALNRVTSMGRGNGVDTLHTFDPAGRLLSISHKKGATVLAAMTYGYDAAGSRISQQTNVGQPLITQPAPATFNDGNQILTRATSTFTHDANGNLTRESGPGGVTSYAWDGRNRLASLALPGGTNFEFSYDPEGMLLRYAENAANRAYLSDDLTNTADFRVGSTQYSVLSGRSIDDLAAVRSGDSSEYSHADAINSTVITSGAAGSTTNQISYEPFGAVLSASATQEPLTRFTGRLQLTEDLYYYRARYYRPSHGRFVSEDPISAEQGSSYRYALNDPIALIDPSGESAASAICLAACLLSRSVSPWVSGSVFVTSGEGICSHLCADPRQSPRGPLPPSRLVSRNYQSPYDVRRGNSTVTRDGYSRSRRCNPRQQRPDKPIPELWPSPYVPRPRYEVGVSGPTPSCVGSQCRIY